MNYAIAGARGRMGQAILSLLTEDDQVFIKPAHDQHGFSPTSAARVRIVPDLEQACRCADVFIDFSVASMALQHLNIARATQIPFLLGTTGLDASVHQAFRDAGHSIPVLCSSNTSLGIHLLKILVRTAMDHLPREAFDIEIVEAHHKHKVDAPSGTALSLLDVIRQHTSSKQKAQARPQQGARPVGSVGMSSIRGGKVVGDHEVMFLGEYESITLTHHAMSRQVFAAGAIHIARWLCQQKSGVYDMDDVFFSLASLR